MPVALAVPSSLPAGIAVDDVAGRSSAAAPRAAAGASGLAPAGASVLSELVPWLTGALADSTASWLVSPSTARPGSGVGYAPAAGSAAAKAQATSSSAPKITGEWSFLADASLSVEEKLARFMAAAQKKLDDELTQKMEDYKAKYGEGGTEAKKKDSGGAFSSIFDVFGAPLQVVGDLLGGADGFLKDALQSLGGPLLAALATAAGLPTLAPAALALGKELGKLLGGDSSTAKKAGTTTKTDTTKKTDAKGSGTATAKPKTDAKTATGEAGSPDERLQMLEIQRLVDKQNQLFTLVSNVMKSMHDTSMVSVQNMR